MSSSPCLADAGASIQLETTVINPSSGGVFIPTFSTGGYEYTYTETIPPIVTVQPAQPIIPPVIMPPQTIPPKVTIPSESITVPLPIEPMKPFPWIYILIALLGIVGITLFILGLRKRRDT